MSSDLFAAIQLNDFDAVKRLIANGADVNASSKIGNTPLHWAAKYGHAAIVEYLVSHGADVNASNRFGYTPLHWAARSGHAAIIDILERADANEPTSPSI